MSRQRRFFATAMVLLLGASAGCDDIGTPATFIERVRVIGAEVHPLADPSRATLRRGEEARASLLLAYPSPVAEARWLIVVCAETAAGFDLDACLAAPLVRRSGTSQSSQPEVTFETPQSDEVVSLRLIAAVCQEGDPRPNPWSPCEGGTVRGTAVQYEALVSAGPPNLHPSFEGATLTLDDAPWPPGATSCADARHIAPGASSTLRWSGFVDTHFQRYTKDGKELREELLLSNYTSGGSLDRLYSIFRESATEQEVAFTAPEEVPAEGQLLRLSFVLRDGRGGIALTRRSLCVKQ